MAKSRGRPAWQPTAKDRETVRTLAGYGVAQDKIAAVLRITDRTLRKYCRHELDTGATDATAQVAQSMYRMALRGPYSVRYLGCRVAESRASGKGFGVSGSSGCSRSGECGDS